jgi:hypothetical protein
MGIAHKKVFRYKITTSKTKIERYCKSRSQSGSWQQKENHAHVLYGLNHHLNAALNKPEWRKQKNGNS